MNEPEEYVTISVPRATAQALAFYRGELAQSIAEWASSGMADRVLSGTPNEGEIRNERVVLAVIGGMVDTLGRVAECAAHQPVTLGRVADPPVTLDLGGPR